MEIDSATTTELEAAWTQARACPAEPTHWTTVTRLAEKLGDIARIREAYDELLGRFPLCYGFWNKYATLEKEHGDAGKAIEVFERGVVAVDQSVELWIAYAAAFAEISPDDVAGTRRLYARAAAAVGSNLLGGPLWQAWEAWEATRDSGSHDHLLPVLWHALAQPLKEAEAILARALALARATPAAAVAAAWLSADERAAVEAEVKAASAVAQATPAAAPAADGAAAAPEPVDPAAAAEAALSAAVCARAEARSASARAERAARAPLEAQLRRHYYHWKPLDAQQLVGWHAYLDFETARATAAAAGAQDEGACAAATARCMALFERCVVACAAYGEFWCRYANWLRAPRGPAAALALLVRSRPHAPAHVRLGLARALGYEETGDTEEAERAYAELAEALAAAPPSLAQPGVASALGGALVEVAIARFNFERRRQAEAKKGAPDAAGALLRADLAKARARALGATPADAELACAHVLALASRLASHLLAAPAGGAAASAADGARAVFDELLAAPAAGAPAAAAAAPAADSDGGADADATDGAPPPLALPRGALRKAWLAYASLETRCAALAPAAKGRGKAAAPADSAARRVCAVYARGLGLASLAEACGAAAASAGASAEQHVSAPDDRQLLLSCMRQYAADHALDAHWLSELEAVCAAEAPERTAEPARVSKRMADDGSWGQPAHKVARPQHLPMAPAQPAAMPYYTQQQQQQQQQQQPYGGGGYYGQQQQQGQYYPQQR